MYSSEQILITFAFVGLFDLLVLVALVHYSRCLAEPFLKFGAYAMAFEILSLLSASISQIYELSFALTIGWIGKLLFSVMLLAGLSHLSGRRVPIALILSMMLVFLLGSLGAKLFDWSIGFAWLFAEIPRAVLLMVGLVYLTDSKRRTPRNEFPLILMLGLHLCLRIVGPFAVLNPTLFSLIYLFDSIVLMLVGASLLLIALERLVGRAGERDEVLERFEQENRRLEIQFSQAQKLESLGVLAGGIAHDFNNMLTSILGYTSLAIKKLPIDSDIRKDLYMVMSGARQAVDLTSQMLVYAGKGAIEFESLDVSRVVDNMSGLVNSIVPRKIRLVHKVARNLPLVKGDAVQLGQIVMNLVANGVDAIGANTGTIEIGTGITDVDSVLLSKSLFSADHEPGAFIYLRVKDTGIGMDSSQLSKVFDPFYSDNSAKKGLGLSSISGIVRQHKGFVHIESELGNGTQLTAYFPLVTYKDPSVIAPGNQTMMSARMKGRVLLADDDPRIRSLIASILESDSFSMTSVEDGREAMKNVDKNGVDYDVFVLDCTMPKMSGTEVYREIRASGLKTPVVLLSGYHQEQVIQDIGRDDHAYFIKKPFAVDALLELVNTAIAEKASNRIEV